jgi:uracil-DNA glycosylase family 4
VTQRERAVALQVIADEIAVCTRCRLHEGRTRTVPGEGHPSTEVVFVGEGPGFNEDQQGRPFVGAAGQVLDELLHRVDWRRQEVFITTVVKCRPPGNRDPEPDEIAACAPFLRRQLEVLDPALVVTLGRHSLDTFRPGARISQVHGTVAPTPASTGATSAMHLALYHPAAALRSTAIKETIVAESAAIPAALQEARARRRATTEPATPREAMATTVSDKAAVAVEPEAEAPALDQMNLFR